MTVNHEASTRRSDDRRRRRDGDHRTASRRPSDPGASRRTRPRAGKASVPGREPGVSQAGPGTTAMPRPAVRSARPKNTDQAKARAKARKAKAPKLVRPALRDRLITRLASIDLSPRTLAGKVPFVVLVIGSLGVGLGLTLWLSTDAAERSYRLGSAREQDRILQQQKEALERDVLEAQAAPALAEEARKLGMIPTKDTAHLVRDPVGNWVVVGTPKPAEGVPPPPLNTKLPEEKPAAPPAPPADSVEVPVRVPPDAGGATVPRSFGPEVLVRAPDGATTLGTQHLPAGGPSAPGPVALPGPGPVTALPPAVGSAPAAPPGEEPVAAEPPAGAPAPPVAQPGPTVPANVEQFGPVTPVTDATAGAAR